LSELRVEAGKTVVVKGPASIALVEGRANILGYPMNPKRPVVVKSWRARPVYVEENSLFKYTCGEGGGVEVVDGDTVPPEWREAVSEITQLGKVTVSVYGSIDSGKTSLATLAANWLRGGLPRLGYRSVKRLSPDDDRVCLPEEACSRDICAES